jgi:hypothetical protein
MIDYDATIRPLSEAEAYLEEQNGRLKYNDTVGHVNRDDINLKQFTRKVDAFLKSRGIETSMRSSIKGHMREAKHLRAMKAKEDAENDSWD